uniref:Uncharacterized protein n=1 Tax=Lepeophtheirus salmonis TaxID=72036 RepID=A0A0K2VL37_LEPSM
MNMRHQVTVWKG